MQNDHDFLCHHGIKGQKWGVRRYQNPDGSLTEAGKARYTARRNIVRNRPYTDAKNDIVRSLSDKEKKLLGASLNEDWIEKDYEAETLSNLAKSFVTSYEDTPISFLEIWSNGGRTGQIAIATRNDEKYRGKGYASKEVEKAIKWCEQYGYKSLDELEWIAEKSNTGSRRLAEKYGFVEDKDQKWEDYVYYHRKVKKP